jgi:hypothetical protein
MTKKMKYLRLEDTLREKLQEIRSRLEIENLWQLPLLTPANLARRARDTQSSEYVATDIIKLWQLGLLQADLVVTSATTDMTNLSLNEHGPQKSSYDDRRVVEHRGSGYSEIIKQLPKNRADIELFFHPFRCHVLYHLSRSTLRRMLNPALLKHMPEREIKCFDEWSRSQETIQCLQRWNDLTLLAVVSEPSAHITIFGSVRHSHPATYESTWKALGETGKELEVIYAEIGESRIEEYRQSICLASETLDPNKKLHVAIRLMDQRTQESLKGKIAGAMLFFYMAESLRRTLENGCGRPFPEEDEMGFGQVRKYRSESELILDGDRVVANQFLRSLGLDYGVRANIYVEGSTEYGALQSEFRNNGSVLVIDLKGKVIEKKSLSFRESLRNDLKAKTFSLLIFDGDRSDNIRAVARAAEDDEICGLFFVCKPDFEFQNFTREELCEVVLTDDCSEKPSQTELERATDGASDATEFFKKVMNTFPELDGVTKGSKWREMLAKYAREHPRGDFGDESDRFINQLIRAGLQCCSFQYDHTRNRYKTDPSTGQPTIR